MLNSNAYRWVLKFLLIGLGLYLASSLSQETRPLDAQPHSSQSYNVVSQVERGNQLKYAKIENQTMSVSPLSSRVITASNLLHYFQASKSESKVSDFILNKHVLVFDARNLYPKFMWSHVQGAQHSPWRQFTKAWRSGVLVDLDVLTEKVQALGLNPEKRVIIYGDWEQGWGEEARLLWLLEYLGHEKVQVVEGGWEAIKKAKVPRVRGSGSFVRPSSWQPTPREELRADSKKVEVLLSKSILSVDARSLEEYQGATPYGSSYGGHLPNSVRLEINDVLDSNHRLKSKNELQHLFHSLGAELEHPIFTYCTGGVRSAFIYLALREAGFNKTMNYDGSWWEWTKLHPLK